MKVKFLQEGGQIAPESAQQNAAPAGQDQAMEQLAQLAQQIIQQLGPEGASALAQMILEMVQGGGEEPMPAEENQPVFRMGGKIARGVRR